MSSIEPFGVSNSTENQEGVNVCFCCTVLDLQFNFMTPNVIGSNFVFRLLCAENQIENLYNANQALTYELLMRGLQHCTRV